MPAKSSQPKKAKKSTPKKTASATTVVEPAPVEVAAPVEVVAPPAVETQNTTTSTESVELGEWAHLDEQFKEIIGRIQEFRTLSASLQSDVKRLQKNVSRTLKDNAKRNRRRRKGNENKAKRAPSGFAKPALISDELCDFLGMTKGTEMARTEVTKHLTQYIKEHSLQDAVNRRKIIPDKRLGKLLNVGKDDEVTYFNLQKYMKVHFPKSAAALAAAALASSSA